MFKQFNKQSTLLPLRASFNGNNIWFMLPTSKFLIGRFNCLRI